MRCLGCNRVMTVFEERMTKSDGTQEDLCTLCRRAIADYIHLDDLRSGDVLTERDLFDFDDEDDPVL